HRGHGARPGPGRARCGRARGPSSFTPRAVGESTGGAERVPGRSVRLPQHRAHAGADREAPPPGEGPDGVLPRDGPDVLRRRVPGRVRAVTPHEAGRERRGRIVVTGVAGFIGSNLADRLLAEGYHVIGVDDLSYGVLEQVPSGVEFHRIDVRSPELYPVLEGADAVFHLAAKNCIADCQADPVETASINVLGTVNVFEGAVRGGVGKVVYAESSALYEGSSVLPTPEAEIAPESFYAVSKVAGRAFAEAYARFHGLKLTALRYFCVYGPRQDYRRTIPPVMSAFILR